MALSRAPRVAPRRSQRLRRGGGDGDHFPFLDLPDDLIYHTFSFMSIQDRLRARVNRRLNNLELLSHYRVEKLVIDEQGRHFGCRQPSDGQSCSPDFIKRISQTASIGYLRIQLRGSENSNRDIYHSMVAFKKFNLDELELEIPRNMEREIMVDSYLLGLTRVCKILYVKPCTSDNISAEALRNVYKSMMKGSATLRELHISVTDRMLLKFLGLIGIIYRDRQFFSNRGIEVYKMLTSEERSRSANRHDDDGNRIIFDGKLEIEMDLGRIGNYVRNFKMKVHDTRELLEREYTGEKFVKIVVSPI